MEIGRAFPDNFLLNVTGTAITLTAGTDPVPDPDAAARGRFGGLIASGWQTCCMAMRLAADAMLQGSNAVASPGLAYVKWPHPVRPGDQLCLRAEVLDTRTSRSRPDLGILRWRWQLFNQLDIEVLDLEATSLFDLSSADA